MAEQKINRNYLVIGGLALATILALVLIRVFDSNSSNEPLDDPLVEELNIEIQQLESSIMELELIYTDKDEELDDMLQLVDQKNDRLVALEKKIQQLEEEGIVSQETIDRLKAQLDRARRIADSQTKVNELVRAQSTLTRMLDSLQQVVFVRDSAMAVAEAKLLNCGGEAAVERGIEEVSLEPALSIRNLQMFNVDKAKGNRVEIQKQVKAKDIEELEFCVDLVGNSAFPTSVVRLNLIVRSLDGRILESKGGNTDTIIINGKEELVTNSSKVNYVQNTPLQGACIFYLQDDYPTGTYNVEIYHESKKIGSRTLFLY